MEMRLRTVLSDGRWTVAVTCRHGLGAVKRHVRLGEGRPKDADFAIAA
jgi:hypothetical protein